MEAIFTQQRPLKLSFFLNSLSSSSRLNWAFALSKSKSPSNLIVFSLTLAGRFCPLERFLVLLFPKKGQPWLISHRPNWTHSQMTKRGQGTLRQLLSPAPQKLSPTRKQEGEASRVHLGCLRLPRTQVATLLPDLLLCGLLFSSFTCP